MVVTEEEVLEQVRAFQKRLRDMLDDAGYNDYRLSKALGKPQTNVARLFDKDSFPEVETLIPIAKLLGVRVMDLFAYDTENCVDYGIQIIPGDIKICEIRHELEYEQRRRLLAYAEGLRDGK
jgi:hypothetical protein